MACPASRAPALCSPLQMSRPQPARRQTHDIEPRAAPLHRCLYSRNSPQREPQTTSARAHRIRPPHHHTQTAQQPHHGGAAAHPRRRGVGDGDRPRQGGRARGRAHIRRPWPRNTIRKVGAFDVRHAERGCRPGQRCVRTSGGFCARLWRLAGACGALRARFRPNARALTMTASTPTHRPANQGRLARRGAQGAQGEVGAVLGSAAERSQTPHAPAANFPRVCTRVRRLLKMRAPPPAVCRSRWRPARAACRSHQTIPHHTL